MSLAVARAAAASLGVPLFRYLGGPSARTLPVPCLNVLNGGAHAANSVDIQEFMIVPAGFPTFAEALRAGVEVYQALKKVIGGRGLGTNVGDEGGFAPDLPTNEAALDLLVEAIGVAGYELGAEIALALDVAATELHREGRYHLEGQRPRLRRNGRLPRGPGGALPTGVGRGRHGGRRLGRVGRPSQPRSVIASNWSATTCSSPTRSSCAKGIAESAANAILIKVNQIGSVSETLHTMSMARGASYGTMVSHRSGETEDSFISHLAVATDSGQIKSGAPARGERTAKYNELLRIEEELGPDARFPGWSTFRRPR